MQILGNGFYIVFNSDEVMDAVSHHVSASCKDATVEHIKRMGVISFDRSTTYPQIVCVENHNRIKVRSVPVGDAIIPELIYGSNSDIDKRLGISYDLANWEVQYGLIDGNDNLHNVRSFGILLISRDHAARLISSHNNIPFHPSQVSNCDLELMLVHSGEYGYVISDVCPIDIYGTPLLKKVDALLQEAGIDLRMSPSLLNSIRKASDIAKAKAKRENLSANNTPYADNTLRGLFSRWLDNVRGSETTSATDNLIYFDMFLHTGILDAPNIFGGDGSYHKHVNELEVTLSFSSFEEGKPEPKKYDVESDGKPYANDTKHVPQFETFHSNSSELHEERQERKVETHEIKPQVNKSELYDTPTYYGQQETSRDCDYDTNTPSGVSSDSSTSSVSSDTSSSTSSSPSSSDY